MAFVMTPGGVRGLAYPPPRMPFLDGTVRLNTGQYMTYEALWRRQPAIRTVTGFLARQLSSIPGGVYEGGLSDDDRHRVRNHPLERLFRRPLRVPGVKLTRYGLFSHLVHELCIYDNAFWLKLRTEEGSPPVGLLPIPARMVRDPDEPDSWYSLRKYRIEGSGGYVEVDAEHIVHVKGYNPEDTRFGVSPMETLRGILAEEVSAQTYREQLWRNGARFAGYITRPPAREAGKWSPADRERFTQMWRAQYAGDTASWLYGGGTPVLEDGMAFVPAGVTPRDAQYIESRKLTREEVAAAYWLPPSALSIFDSADRAMAAQREILYMDALPPWCRQLEQDIDLQLLEDLDPDASDGSKYFEFNLRSKLEGSFLEQVRTLQSAIGAPWMTRKEGRKVMNLGHLDGQDIDQLIVPLNVVEGGLASPNDTAPANPSNEESNRPENQQNLDVTNLLDVLGRMERSVLSKVGASAAVIWSRWEGITWANRWEADVWSSTVTDIRDSLENEAASPIAVLRLSVARAAFQIARERITNEAVE